MSEQLEALPKVMGILLELSSYPMRASHIRERMRSELFARGVITSEVLEKEVKDKAILSQKREGILDPLVEEPAETWEQRKAKIRDDLTDFYFAYNLPRRLLHNLIRQEVGAPEVDPGLELFFNPELAPWDMLFAQGRQFEALPPEQLSRVRHHLQEIKVVLIKAMISDQLNFVGVAREYFSIADLEEIRRRRLGRGKIGGKAAGMMLAWKILQRDLQPVLGQDPVAIPESFFVGADVFYEFLELNGLVDVLNQKYKSPEEIVADYQGLPERFAQGRFRDHVVQGLQKLLADVGNAPLIVRSSSLLEDNFSTSFAGKYDSVFCPNQGTPEENLQALTRAIAQVYVSVFSPDALLYRQQRGLIDYDERMAILIQLVKGETYGDYFFPTVAGVGFSHNPFLWTPRLQRLDGFVRLVTGLGTRAVDRVPDDYPRMIGLSHPTLRPEREAHRIRHYSQHFMDVVDLGHNRVRAVSVGEVIDSGFPWLRLLASIDRGTHIEAILFASTEVSPEDLVITLDGLVARTDFVDRMKKMLHTLEAAYSCPVDVEFTVQFHGTRRKPDVRIHLLQCRPQSNLQNGESIEIPRDVPAEDILFTADYLVPNGVVDDVRYVVYVDPESFDRLPLPSDKHEIARVLGRLNQRLAGKPFILIGPGRWGSSNVDLGVKVTYADIYNTRMLIEIGLDRGSGAPEVSHGTHFFQDLVEAKIYPLALFPDRPGNRFDWNFFRRSPNLLGELLPADAVRAPVVRVIDVPAARAGKLLRVVMSGEQGEALAYFRDR